MAFSCGLAALAIGQSATIFLTSEGTVWGFEGSGIDIQVQGFLPLSQLIAQFADSGGSIILCSVCQQTCGPISPLLNASLPILKNAEIGGFATILERSIGGLSLTF